MRPHPNSGAGRIKFDGSSETEVGEVKTAAKSYTVQRQYMIDLFTNAVRQGKTPILIIKFPGYLIECRVRKE